MYVNVDTADSFPLSMLMARAMIEPMNEPNWKIAQKMANAFPLSFSSGYDIMMEPCADHRRAAEMPSIAPAKITNHPVPRVW